MDDKCGHDLQVSSIYCLDRSLVLKLDFIRANHAKTQVYNQSVNACLQHVVATEEGDCPTPLASKNRRAKGYLPPLPRPGEVDIIFGG